ncbi:hypothetical protein AMS68_006846 [Peltaster fructicola]|uniref:NmrA-like domain-containing protein n=1 Tax=Peltaster fructicola TaxID=286661 RepID=A0A6H0Y394_9PEZI|nr:hypothetical protein AMS68_006846 [Peltaster fructicola]
MSRIITVFGATGAQGGSVVEAILNHPKLSQLYKVRGITRDTTKPAAQALHAKGVELVQADMNHVESLQEALRGSYAVFAVTNYWEHEDKELEFKHGKNITDASVAEKVHHLIWSSLPHVTKLTNGALQHVSHFDSKANVEEYIRSIPTSSLPVSTFFMPAFYMSNIKSMTFPGQDGTKNFAQPWQATETHVALLDTKKDTGNYVAGILLAPESTVQHLSVQGVSEWRTPQEIVDTITTVTGSKVNFVEVTREQGFQAMGANKKAEELIENMLLVRDYSYYGKGSEKETAKSQALLPEKPTTWADFVKASW